MAKKHPYSVIVARSTAFWYCKILSVLCQYDMGSITQREALFKINEILSYSSDNEILYDCHYPLLNLANWDYIRRMVEIAYMVRGFRFYRDCTGSYKKRSSAKQYRFNGGNHECKK